LKLENKVGILKLGTIWPLPRKLIELHLGKSQKILMVEEIDPFLEGSIKRDGCRSTAHYAPSYILR